MTPEQLDAELFSLAPETTPPVGICPPAKNPRISVGLTREEMGKVHHLARRLNTSVSALGQLAFRNLLLQADAGALPLLPKALTFAAAEPTLAEIREQFSEQEKASQAKINLLEAKLELLRLDELANPE